MFGTVFWLQVLLMPPVRDVNGCAGSDGEQHAEAERSREREQTTCIHALVFFKVKDVFNITSSFTTALFHILLYV